MFIESVFAQITCSGFRSGMTRCSVWAHNFVLCYLPHGVLQPPPRNSEIGVKETALFLPAFAHLAVAELLFRSSEKLQLSTDWRCYYERVMCIALHRQMDFNLQAYLSLILRPFGTMAVQLRRGKRSQAIICSIYIWWSMSLEIGRGVNCASQCQVWRILQDSHPLYGDAWEIS